MDKYSVVIVDIYYNSLENHIVLHLFATISYWLMIDIVIEVQVLVEIEYSKSVNDRPVSADWTFFIIA